MLGAYNMLGTGISDSILKCLNDIMISYSNYNYDELIFNLFLPCLSIALYLVVSVLKHYGTEFQIVSGCECFAYDIIVELRAKKPKIVTWRTKAPNFVEGII